MQSLTLTTCSGLGHPNLAQSWWKWDRPPVHSMTGWLNGEPVGIVRTFDVKLSMPGVAIECVGLGGVFVAEQHRGNGYAKQIVNGLLMSIGNRSLPFVLRARDGRLYEKLGFTRVGTDHEDDMQGIYVFSRCAIQITHHVAWQLNRKF